ncbi:MAG: hypothetical protein QNJ11_00130 [Woeseiaceae bacterium]|nr:hypothetical protein [Woeseiaceae bacterium]
MAVLLSPQVSAADPQRILFVGNSFSFYNNGIHTHYRKLADAAGSSAKARLFALSGGTLAEHTRTVAAVLAAGSWDIVVLQGHSLGAFDPTKVESFRSSAAILTDMIRKVGAEPNLFMTWAYEGRPEMTEAVASEYFETGQAVNAAVVPVGLAFGLVTETHPEIALRTSDAKHPTLAGTYLAACVFFARLERQSPVGLDYTAGLDVDVARKLQSAAWQTVNREASP